MSDQDELEKIKQQKLKKLLERAEKMQSMKEKEEKIQQEQEQRVKEARSYILARTLDPDASNYLGPTDAIYDHKTFGINPPFSCPKAAIL